MKEFRVFVKGLYKYPVSGLFFWGIKRKLLKIYNERSDFLNEVELNIIDLYYVSMKESFKEKILTLIQQYYLINKSTLFDAAYYRQTYYNEKLSDVQPLIHYLLFGFILNYNPSANFNAGRYLKVNKDVKYCGINPLYHFLNYGFLEDTRSNDGFVVFKNNKRKNIRALTVRNCIKCFFQYGDKYTRAVFLGNGEESQIIDYKKPIKTWRVKKTIKSFEVKPLFSIIMPVYNIDVKWLKSAIKSVKKQWYKNWELCIADDCSTNTKTVAYLKSIKYRKIKIKFLNKNLNISGTSNQALQMAEGEYVVLLDNDDMITVDALYELTKCINETGAEFIYSDQDNLFSTNIYSFAFFKPGFNYELLKAQNYINHLTAIKRRLIEDVDGWEVGLEGAQDHDLYLKIVEKTNRIAHIQKILYHWRAVEGSTAAQFSEKEFAQTAGRVAVQNAINRCGESATVIDGRMPGTYRVKYILTGTPLVSIIIPFRDKINLLTDCITSILEKSTYTNFEIICINNQSEDKKTYEEISRLRVLTDKIFFYDYIGEFNYSKINNTAVYQYAKGEYVVLLNNDIKIITSEWIENMLMFAQKDEVGAVGAKLYFDDDTIQHAGIVVGINNSAGHSFKGYGRNASGYFARLCVNQYVSAVTAAMLMISKKKYIELSGLNEKEFAIGFNDVDFCLRLREHGYENVFTPYAEAYHYESKSRGYDDTPEREAKHEMEKKSLKERHGDYFYKVDPYYNINLTTKTVDYSIKRDFINRRYKQ